MGNEQSLVERFAKNFSSYTLIGFLTSSISFLLLPILTAYLSPEDYGILSLFNSSQRVVIAVISIGSMHVLLTRVNHDKDHFKHIFTSYIKLNLVNTCLVFMIISLLVLFFGEFIGIPAWLMMLLPLISFLVIVYETVINLQVFRQQVKRFASYSLSKFFIEISLTLVLVALIGWNWVGRIISLIAALALVLVLSHYYLKQSFVPSNRLKDFSRSIIRKGIYLFFLDVSIIVMNLSDRFFVNSILDLNATGIYSVAYMVASAITMLQVASIKVVRPILYKNFRDKQKAGKLLLIHLAILLGGGISLFLFSPLIFSHFIDGAYKEGLEIIWPLIVGLVAWGINIFFASFLIYFNYQKILGIISIFGTFVNLLLNYFLITYYGIFGAGLATMITYLTILSITFLFVITKKSNVIF